MRNGPAPLGALSLVLATALAAPVASAESGRDFHWSGNVASGTTLSISDVNGKIVATHAASRAADVRARIHSNDDSDLKDVNVVMKQWAGHVAFCAVYSGQTVDDKCSVSGSHTDMKTHETVDFTVTVPDGVPLDAKTVNGAVSATGLNAPVWAKSVNGAITIATSGSADAKVVNGSIDARMGSAGWKGALAFKTVNGSVSIYLPKTAGFTLNAKSVNGEISAGDFGLHEEGVHFVGHSLSGRAGNGGGELNVKTVNGFISVTAT